MAAHDDIATLRRSLRVVRGERTTWSVAVEARRIMATPKVHALRQSSLLYSVALLIFFPAAAGTGVVATDFIVAVLNSPRRSN